MEDAYNQVFAEISRVLVVIAHPDDLDVMAGGTISRLIDDGKEVRALVCTNGAFGSKDNEISTEELTNIRSEEQKKAISHLGMKNSELSMLNYDDCTLLGIDPQLIEAIVYNMREFRPDIIITHDFETIMKKRNDGKFSINHRDHREVGLAVINAVMPMARDISFFPQHKEQGLKGVVVKKILIGDMTDGDVAIDIDETIADKMEALLCHKSQFDEDTIRRIMLMNDENRDHDTEVTDYFERFRFYELAY